ncbi:MAG: universal stress protein [Acidobacteria bacterium]|nr:universal stress protein [Acidobacteriota bacterium]
MKILLAVDGSKYANNAATECCRIISPGEGSELRIVSVAEYSVPVGIEPFAVSSEFYITVNNELKKVTEGYVADAEALVKKEIGDKMKIETKVLRGSPKVEIVREAEEWGADLIVVGSHGYGFFERMLIGSVSNAILHHAPCSVLVVKSRDAGDKE